MNTVSVWRPKIPKLVQVAVMGLAPLTGIPLPFVFYRDNGAGRG